MTGARVSTTFQQFLGTERWKALMVALRSRSSVELEPALGLHIQLLAGLIASTPVAITFLDDLRPRGTPASVLPTVAFGVCALLALLCRSRLGLSADTGLPWRRAMSLTHTAVALGCIPAALVLVLSHSLLADRHDVLRHAMEGGPQTAAPLSHFARASLLTAIAAWVALTEELIFRGLLVSVIRRARLLPSQRMRDTAAVTVSATLFGFAHWATWGPLAALALTGLGVGFVLGYIANGERLGPIIVYHFGFDLLSLAISTW